MTATSVVVVLCTAPPTAPAPRLGADALARQLVEERLCACGSVLPGVRSHYRWQGAVEVADELLLLLKTTSALLPQLRARLLELHPYSVPELLELPVAGGAPAYLQWVADSVGDRVGG